MTEKLSKISEFLENLEAVTVDKATAKKIREFMAEEKLWMLPTPPLAAAETPVKEEEAQIVYNAVVCLACNETIVSRTRHDYKTCGCENEAMVDGGTDYARYGAKDLSKIYKITYDIDDPHDLIRCFLAWGTYGKNGDQPLKYVPVKDMSDEHIRNILHQENLGAAWVRQILRTELDYRTEFNISITD